MTLQFFMPMVPPTATHQEQKVRSVRRGNKMVPQYYDPPDLADARAKLTAHLSQHRPANPLEGPVGLTVKWCFPAGCAHSDGEWRITPPDTDNLQKLLKDCMTRLGFWQDDAQVCWDISMKVWAKLPGIYIGAVELEGGESVT